MADSNILDIILRFKVDGNSQKAAQDAVKSMGAGTTGAGTAAGVTGQMDKLAASVKSIKGDGLDDLRQQFADMGQEVDNLAEKTKAYKAEMAEQNAANRGLEAMRTGIRRAIEDAEKLQFIFMRIGVAGGAMLAPLLLSANKYIQYAGMAGGVSSQWLASTQRLEQAQLRIGQAVARAVLPAIERAADLMDKVAAIAEANPWLVNAALGLGTILTTVGAVGSLYSTAKGLLARAALLSLPATAANVAAAGAGTAAGGATATAATGVIAGTTISAGLMAVVVALGALNQALPMAIGKAVASALNIKPMNQNAPAQALSLGAYGAGSLVGAITGDATTANRWLTATAQALGLLGNQAQSTASQIKTASGEMVPQGAVDAYIAYQQAETQAAQQNEEQRLQIVQDFGRQRADQERQNEEKRADILRQIAELQNGNIDTQTRIADARALRNFAQNERQQESSYYANRLKIIADAGVEAERAEEDHQRRMLQLQQDHALTVEDLLDKQDAFGLLSEMRSYEQQRQQNEQSYQVETSRRSEDLARRLAEMDNEFAQARARRMADYQQQRADEEVDRQARRAEQIKSLQDQLKRLDADYKTQKAMLDRQETEKLNQLQKRFNDERQSRYTNFANQLRDLGVYMQNETNLRSQFYAAWTAQFQQFMQANLQQLQAKAMPPPGRASGGYVGPGVYQVGEEGYEYVLNHQTTMALEKLSQSKLTQSKITALLTGNTGGQTVIYNDQRRIDGRVTAADKRDLRNDQMRQLGELFA